VSNAIVKAVQQVKDSSIALSAERHGRGESLPIFNILAKTAGRYLVPKKLKICIGRAIKK
jgi:hypothetical protein